MDTPTTRKSSCPKNVFQDFSKNKHVRKSNYFIDGYTIYTLNIHFGWYQWQYDKFEKSFSREHLAIAMSNPDNIIWISPGARRKVKDNLRGEPDQSLPISTGGKLNDEGKVSGKEVKLLALCPGEKINNEDKVWEKQKIPNNFR